MNAAQTFNEFLATQSAQISIIDFLLNMLITAVLTFLLSRIYMKYGTSLSNRRMFAGNFVLIAVTTMLIITIVKSSLALSLGLVGALSIVRFRTAIKEPEELAYLFLAISIGLGLGADQRLITITAFFTITLIIMIGKLLHKPIEAQNIFLTISSQTPNKIGLEQIVETLKKYCLEVDIKRFDEDRDIIEATFQVEFDGISSLQKSKKELQELNDSLKITFLDNKGVF